MTTSKELPPEQKGGTDGKISTPYSDPAKYQKLMSAISSDLSRYYNKARKARKPNLHQIVFSDSDGDG